MHSRTLLVITAFVLAASPVVAQPKRSKHAEPATKADVERLEKKLEQQQRTIDALLKASVQHMQTIAAILTERSVDPKTAAKEPSSEAEPVSRNEPPKTETVKTEPTRTDPEPTSPVPKKPAVVAAAKPPKAKPIAKGVGSVVGRIKGATDAVIYIDLPGKLVAGTATMRQEGKQFVPRTLVVQRGTKVEFPNRDAFFHNVFSVTPDSSFDLGSYRQGESKTVALTKAGVVNVYCNMHPQMVGHILVVPSSHFSNAGQDGFFKIGDVPTGKHRVVAWAPNAKPVTAEIDVIAGQATTVELELKKGRTQPHTNKEGLPYGSYKE